MATKLPIPYSNDIGELQRVLGEWADHLSGVQGGIASLTDAVSRSEISRAAIAELTAKWAVANQVVYALNGQIAAINTDDILDIGEKRQLVILVVAIQNSQTSLDAQAASSQFAGLVTTEVTAFDNAVAALMAFLTALGFSTDGTTLAWSDLRTDTALPTGGGVQLRALLNNVALTQENLRSKMTNLAKLTADNAATAATSALAAAPSVGNILPTLPDPAYPQGKLFFLTTDNKLYRSTGTAWTVAVPTTDLTGTVTTAQIASGAVTAAQLAASSVDTSKLAAGAVDNTKVANALQIPAIVGTLPTSGYQNGSLVYLTTDGKVYRNTGSTAAPVWSKAVDGADITANSITAGTIAAGAIGTTQLAAGAVTAEKMVLVSGSLILDPDFASGSAGWTGFIQRLPSSNASVPSGCPAAYAGQFGSRDNPCNPTIKVQPGEQYRANIHCHPNGGTGGGGVGILVYGRNASGVVTEAYALASATANTWNFVSATLTVGASTVLLQVGPWIDYATFTNGAAGPPWFTSMGLRKVNDATLIVDGSIITSKLAAGAVTTDKLLVTPGTAQLLRNSSFSLWDGSHPDSWGAYGGGPPTYSQITSGGVDGGAYCRCILPASTVSAGIFTGSDIGSQMSGKVGGVQGGWKPNTTYTISLYAKVPAGDPLTGQQLLLYWNTSPVSTTYVSNPPLTSGWQRYVYRIAWGSSVEGGGHLFLSIPWGTNIAGNVDLDQVLVQEGDVAGSWAPLVEELLPGTIVGQNLVAATITGDKIAANTITASNILTNTITAGQIAAGAIGATQLAATIALVSDFRSSTPAWVPGSAGNAPIGFRMNGAQFTTTFIDGTTDSTCVQELGGSVNFGGYRVQTVNNRTMTAIERVLNGAFYKILQPWFNTGGLIGFDSANTQSANTGSAMISAAGTTSNNVTQSDSLCQTFNTPPTAASITLKWSGAVWGGQLNAGGSGAVTLFLFNHATGVETQVDTWSDSFTTNRATPTWTNRTVDITSYLSGGGAFSIRVLMSATGNMAVSGLNTVRTSLDSVSIIV